MFSLIACPGCKNQLTLPADAVGQRVKCPTCRLDFDPNAPVTPDLQVDSPESYSTEPSLPPIQPALQTAYVSADSALDRKTGAAPHSVVYCSRCGTKAALTQDSCPGCGYPFDDTLKERPRERQRPLMRCLQPVRATLPVIAAILIPLGVVLFICGLGISEGFRRPGSPRFVIGILFVIAADLMELTAVGLFMTWLYRAWRAILRGDEEYSPGLMVGLLFIPFFNFYWVFRAIPGLSATIYQELKFLAGNREHDSGWAIGMVACVLALIPPFWPIAICMFVAWVLITGNALNRLARLHDERRPSPPRDAFEPTAHSER